MAVYLLITENIIVPNVDEFLEEKFPDANHKITDGQWLLSSKKTSKGVSEILASEDDRSTFGRHVVVPFKNYWGYHSHVLWDWSDSHEGEDD